MKKYLLLINLCFSFIGLEAQTNVKAADTYPDIERFGDSARHWYRIFDDDRVIEPVEDQKRYDPSEISKIADNILLFQKDNGGWAKNYDMRAILTEDQRQDVIASKPAQNTTFDNGATHGQLTYLAEAYTVTKDERYKQAFIKGIHFVLAAQYDNGGWPQSYPDSSGYRKHITFNDDAMIGVMVLLQYVAQDAPDYSFLDDMLKNRVKQAYHKGIDCILKCQIVDQGKKTAWCQQHDHVDFSAQNARKFEKASICNKESSQIVNFLMQLENPKQEIIESIEAAVSWFKESEIHGIRVEWIESTEAEFIYHKTRYDKIIIEDAQAPRIWARFYELGTHKPIFCSRDGSVHYAMSEIDRDRRTGYGWYNYAPEEVFTLYDQWHKKINGE